MSKKTTYLIGILLTILIGVYFSWKHCCNDIVINDITTQQIVERDVDIDAEVLTGNAFFIRDLNGDFEFNSSDNFNFDPSGFSILKPLSSNVSDGVSQLKEFLSSNENKFLDITGLYNSNEDNTSAYPNLGIARANSVKNYMVDAGISSTRLNTFGKLDPELSLIEGIYKGPLQFNIGTGDDNTKKMEVDEMEQLGARLKSNPLVLYFDTGSNTIDLSVEQRQFMADISKYLDKVESAKAKITGHTDNTGYGDSNHALGQRRADFAKSYLVKNGINEAKIKSVSRGPDNPIASNNTEGGRAKNRRTVVTIN